MILGQPSRTAHAAATHRAAHQLLEAGRIFSDPLAVRILGRDAEEIRRDAEADPSRRGMRLFIAARSRFAESRLLDGIQQRDVRQLVVLGAGLDTFAYRSPFGAALPIFEIDHPTTQAWKRDRLAEAAIGTPGWLTYAPVDFEHDSLSRALVRAGLDPDRRTFFLWLGVVPYRTPEAVFATLTVVAGLPGGSEVVFDFSDPPASLQPDKLEAHERHAARVAELGEPWLSRFEPAELHARLRRLGFAMIEDLGPRQIAQRYLPGAAERFPERGGHVLHAAMT